MREVRAALDILAETDFAEFWDTARTESISYHSGATISYNPPRPYRTHVAPTDDEVRKFWQ